MEERQFKLEQERLSKTLDIIKDVINTEENDLEQLYKTFVGTRDELWAIADRMKLHISNLETSLDKPYFARIDFTSEVDGETKTVYIGKNGVIRNNEIVVTDWRAPISSLYYDADLGKCSYKVPDGQISGEMTLKRQYEIENGQLSEYFDVDLVSNDDLLQKYLNANNDARLKSIVSTIQKEQNNVIRKPMGDNLIIQGVAGSGKTTVALHRIAYLVYNYINTVSQSNYLVIGPNPVFIKYIKSVLPELDVSGTKQCTFEQFVEAYINENIIINSSDKKVNDNILGKTKHNIDKFKCSMQYKNMLDKYLEQYFANVTSSDLKIGDFVVLSEKMMTEVFKIARSQYRGSLDKLIEIVIERLYTYIESHNDEIISRYNDYSAEVFKKATTVQEKENLRKQFLKERGEIKKNCRSTLKKYFSRYTKVNVTKLYKDFITNIGKFDYANYLYLNELKKETMSNIKKNSYDFEDLVALLYLKQIINPNMEFERTKHVVIDEAQDLGEFNFLAIKKALPQATFSIFGDLAQSIYDYRGIDNWDEVNSVMFENKGEIVNFNKSYRTTSQIMQIADEVAASIGLNKSDLVVRNGNPVEFTNLETNNIPDYIIEKIAEYKEKGYKTIAVISKTDSLSNTINDALAHKGLVIPNVSVDDDLTDPKFRICTISNQLSKGLEFDAVILTDVSEHIYSSNSSLDMKLLYVASTRALHELDVIYSDELTKPLQKFVIKEKDKVLVKA